MSATRGLPRSPPSRRCVEFNWIAGRLGQACARASQHDLPSGFGLPNGNRAICADASERVVAMSVSSRQMLAEAWNVVSASSNVASLTSPAAPVNANGRCERSTPAAATAPRPDPGLPVAIATAPASARRARFSRQRRSLCEIPNNCSPAFSIILTGQYASPSACGSWTDFRQGANRCQFRRFDPTE